MKKIILLLFTTSLAFPLIAQTSKSYKKAIKKHRAEYKAAFLEESHTPFSEKAQLKGLCFYPADETYRLKTTFTRTPNEKPFDMMTSSGEKRTYIKYGTLDFIIAGVPVQLAVYSSPMFSAMPQYKDYLFIPFKDKTNEKTSYGGGRYLEIRTGEIKGGKVSLDFNKAYNPYCAFKSGYSCPIPPKENHLEVAIEAGEQIYRK